MASVCATGFVLTCPPLRTLLPASYTQCDQLAGETTPSASTQSSASITALVVTMKTPKLIALATCSSLAVANPLFNMPRTCVDRNGK